MNRRIFFGGLLIVLCLAALWDFWSQRSRLADLHAEQQQLLAQLTARGADSRSSGTAEPGAASQRSLLVTPELLRLRSEVTRLTERRRELAGVRTENERLSAQVARSTNGTGEFQLPPGYVRRSEARMVGYNSPDDTLQSMLWASRNHDLTNFLQAYTPAEAEHLLASAANSKLSIEDYVGSLVAYPGIAIVGRKLNTNEGSVEVQVFMAPGLPGGRLLLEQINGQWKIAGARAPGQ
jgi:hypothetical protein